MYDFNLNQRCVHLKVGFKSNGLITAIDDFSIADSGVRGSSIFGNTMDQTYGPYFTTRCRNVRQKMDIVDSNRGKMYVSGGMVPAVDCLQPRETHYSRLAFPIAPYSKAVRQRANL
jgi:hypothetical protein